MGETTLVLGIDPGVPRAKAAAAWSVLTLDPAGTIGLLGRSESMRKTELAAFLRNDPLLADERLRLAAHEDARGAHNVGRRHGFDVLGECGAACRGSGTS